MSLINYTLIVLGLIWLAPLSAQASSTRSIDADSIKSSNHSKTYSLPSVTSTLVGDVISETPSGTVNGSNVSFSLSVTPASTTTATLYLDGILDTDYSISGTTITMTTAPALGQSIKIVYHRQ